MPVIMREHLNKLLGGNITKWNRLKVATGDVSDEDLLNKLIDFFAEAKGISLTEPQLPPPPLWADLPTTDGRAVTVSVRPAKEQAAPSAFIVIRQGGPVAGTFIGGSGSDGSAQSQLQRNQNRAPVMTLRKNEQEEEEEMDDCHPAEDVDYEPEFPDIPVGNSKGKIYYREQRHTPTVSRFSLAQGAGSRAVEGMLWREAVLRGKSMPLREVRLVRGSGPHPLTPAAMPWGDETPVRELSSEAVLLREFGCALCSRLGFGSRLEVITHFWLQHPETRERIPTQYLASKRDNNFAHCALCLTVGSVAPDAKRARLESHVTRHAACQRAGQTAPHVCDVCHVELDSEGTRDDHVAERHPEHVARRHVCPVCRAEERGEQAYIRHLRAHYCEFVYACNVCPNFRSRQPQKMAAHTACHERRTFRCGRCPFLTRTFRTLVDHLRGHLKLPRHICSICGHRSNTSSRFFNHMDTHGGRVHRCEICDEEFSSMIKKSQHKILAHRRPAWLTCPHCDVIFKTSCRLRRHLATHTGVKPVKCTMCGKGLSSAQSLRNHTRICPENEELYRVGAVEGM